MGFDARKLTAIALLALVLAVVPFLVGRMTWARLAEVRDAALRDAVAESQSRVRAAMDSQYAELCRTLEDWSAWDAMYNFSLDPTDQQWREENFSPDSVASLGLCRIALYDRNAALVLKSDYDLIGGRAKDFELGPADRAFITGLDESFHIEQTRGGLVLGPDGRLCWAVIKPIRHSDKSGPISGFLKMVRPITPEILEQISATTGATVTPATDAVGQERPDRVKDAELYNSRLDLVSWDGHDIGSLTVGCQVRTILARHDSLQALFVRLGIVAYVILSAASLLTFAAVWTRSVDRRAAEEGTTGRFPVLLAACAGLIFTAAATWGVVGWQDQTHRSEFARRAGNFVQLVRDEISRHLDAMSFSQAYFHSSENVTDEEFERLLANADLWHDGVRLWAWIPHEIGPGAGHDRGILASPASVTDALTELFATSPAMKASCEQARDSGRTVGFVMPENATLSPQSRTVALVSPVYKSSVDSLLEHRRREFRGVILSVVELDKVAAHAADDMDYGGMMARVLSASSRPIIPEAVDETVDGLLVRRCSVPVAEGLSADLTISATRHFRVGIGAAVPMSAAGVGLVLTGLLCAFIEVHLQRTRRVEHLVALRTAELEQRTTELLTANTAAEEAHQAKSAFLANMSHELRTPLTAILGYADLLAETHHAPDAREDFVRTIRRSGEHLLALINAVLDLSKIEAGRMQVETISSSTTGLIEDSLSLLREKAARKKINLAIEYVGKIPATIITDPMRFRQILVNLLGNAVKFTETGGVRVIVRLDGSTTDPDSRLCVEVADTGLGIEPEVMSRLFTPFEQGDGSMSRRFGGTGLGLSISRQLAELLGGTIEAVSVPGEGSSFIFTTRTGSLEGVPMIDPRDPHTGRPPSETGREAPTQFECPDARILLAEDTIDNQRLVRFHLQKLKAEIMVVSDGQEALDAVRQAIKDNKPFDVVLMDMQMPVMDGYTAVRTLRAVGIKVPVVALTAHSSPDDEKRCLEAGCDGFLTKPIGRDALIRTCRQYIARSRASDASYSAAA
ncbi:MAG: Sensor histidine kinase RcsC [Phycisphaerales bacterium]|nr:Sensor histidine kinase RcsC [Phycisphaerales bacterium]